LADIDIDAAGAKFSGFTNWTDSSTIGRGRLLARNRIVQIAKEKRMRKQTLGIVLLGMGVTATSLVYAARHDAEDRTAEDRAIETARRETRMLDDLYKNAIILITKHYVDESSDLPAGSAFQALFKTMKDSGWHEVRLLDGLGEPINDENLPQDDFEKAAIEAILAGKPSHEKIENRDGKRVLRTVTSLPMAMQKCIMCHSNYEGQKVVGGLGYTVPVID
jgi:hypothetical protein